ncbi:unnamed protein product, partial [Didymodactylos carnosus]
VEERPIRKIIKHPLYQYDPDESSPYDIALIELDGSPVNITKYPIICLPNIHGDGSNLGMPDEDVVVAGWGKSQEGEDASPVLLETPLKILDPNLPEWCEPYTNGATALVICAGDLSGQEIHGPCGGDSYAVGVMRSGVAGCGNKSAMYIRVGGFIDWICEQSEWTANQCTIETTRIFEKKEREIWPLNI